MYMNHKMIAKKRHIPQNGVHKRNSKLHKIFESDRKWKPLAEVVFIRQEKKA